MDQVRVGIIGAGLWGVNHIEAYLGLPLAKLAAVADPVPGRAEEIARKYNIARWFESYEDLCACGEIDAVSIVTPESEHRKPVEAAASAGKHILIEKPIAHSVSDAEKMLKAARDAGVILMPGHLLRFEIRYAMVKEMLDQRKLGAIASIQARRNRTKENLVKYARAHPIFSVAVHDIDLLLWYAQAKVRRVRAYERNIQGRQVPDLFWGVVEFSNGILGVLESTWLTPGSVGIFSDDYLEVITDKGIAKLDFVDGGLSFWLENGFYVPDTAIAPRLRGAVLGSLASELSYFLTCVLRNEAPRVVTAEEAVEGLRVAVALADSASQGKEIVIDAG